ncbi:MAG: hypothetical protein LBE48_06290 [Methanomassiliicoccaceae archaeon]|jgi:hypothetical protein|nr:hypothetical protein [Methanomassiliicoccaceae archaeon]
MASGKEDQIIGKVQTQDLSVSWASGFTTDGNTDRLCILTMAHGQVRLTMQSATLNLKGMRLTKGHVCVFALFEAFDPKKGEAADKASEMFMNMMMKYDITKKPAKDVLKKCLSKVDKMVAKEFKDEKYKASIAAFASKDLTVCTVNGGRMFLMSEDKKITEMTSAEMTILTLGSTWKNIMLISGGYPFVKDEIKEDMTYPITETVKKKDIAAITNASIIRAQKMDPEGKR